MNDLDILNEFYKIVRMGMDSYSDVSEKVIDTNMKDEISSQYQQYGNIIQKINNELTKYSDIPKDISMMNKVMSWSGIQLNTLNDKSSSHIADMLIQGSTMGITKSTKLLNENPQMEGNIKGILNEFLTIEQNSIEQLKKYL